MVKEDIMKLNRYMHSSNDMEARIALLRLIEVLEAWRKHGAVKRSK